MSLQPQSNMLGRLSPGPCCFLLKVDSLSHASASGHREVCLSYNCQSNVDGWPLGQYSIIYHFHLELILQVFTSSWISGQVQATVASSPRIGSQALSRNLKARGTRQCNFWIHCQNILGNLKKKCNRNNIFLGTRLPPNVLPNSWRVLKGKSQHACDPLNEEWSIAVKVSQEPNWNFIYKLYYKILMFS